MKKLFLLSATILLASGAFAQQFGVKAGLNFASVSKVKFDDVKSKMKTSFYVGAFYDFKLSDFFAIQPELIYSRQGYSYKDNGTDHWVRQNYLNIPIMAKLTLVDNLTLDLGPQFGFNLNGKAKAKEDGTTVKQSISDALKTFDFAIGMGLTYTFLEHFDVSARYNLGLTEVFKGEQINNDKHRNGVIQIGAGFRF